MAANRAGRSSQSHRQSANAGANPEPQVRTIEVDMDRAVQARARINALLEDDQGPLAKALRRLGANPAPLRQAFGLGLGGDALRAASGIFEVSDSVKDILLRARADADLDHRDKVTPADLLSSFVSQGGGKAAETIRAGEVVANLAVAVAQAGIKTILLPARNRKDIEEIPESARKQLEFVYLETVDDALAAAFEKDAANEGFDAA